MKKAIQSDECSLCRQRFNYILRFEHENVLLCEDCARKLYQKLGRILVPKGLPNMIMRATKNGTIKSIDDLKSDAMSEECEENSKVAESSQAKSELKSAKEKRKEKKWHLVKRI